MKSRSYQIIQKLWRANELNRFLYRKGFSQP